MVTAETFVNFVVPLRKVGRETRRSGGTISAFCHTVSESRWNVRGRSPSPEAKEATSFFYVGNRMMRKSHDQEFDIFFLSIICAAERTAPVGNSKMQLCLNWDRIEVFLSFFCFPFVAGADQGRLRKKR